jgi:hypothetical protein
MASIHNHTPTQNLPPSWTRSRALLQALERMASSDYCNERHAATSRVTDREVYNCAGLEPWVRCAPHREQPPHLVAMSSACCAGFLLCCVTICGHRRAVVGNHSMRGGDTLQRRRGGTDQSCCEPKHDRSRWEQATRSNSISPHRSGESMSGSGKLGIGFIGAAEIAKKNARAISLADCDIGKLSACSNFFKMIRWRLLTEHGPAPCLRSVTHTSAWLINECHLACRGP